MTLNEYQDKAMTQINSRGGVLNSYFPDEIYNFEEHDDKLPLFVEMLKNRGYYIGKDNHIRSKKGTLSSKLMRNGYYMTSAQYDGKMYYFMEHRVVWVWNKGVIPAGYVINHKDYNRANNAIENLELLTQKGNTAYSKCNQRPPRGEKSGKALLTDRQASAVKTVASVCGWTPSVIERVTGVKALNAGRIINGKRYPDAVVMSSIIEAYPIIVDFTRNKEVGKLEELKDYLLGLNGEIGELTDICKKILYHGKEYDPTELMLELGDILYYLAAICLVLDVDITEVLLNNNAKLVARYSEGYSVTQSINRIEENK